MEYTGFISTAPLPSFLSHLILGDDGIFGVVKHSEFQTDERVLREKVASVKYNNYLLEISKYHSIEVMDKEVKKFIQKIPINGIICDVGGCWGWHWRNIHNERPDISVVIVDFVRSNLHHAQRLLGESIAKNIWLVHADATDLPFEAETFDGYWSVQTIQHIPDLRKVLEESKRVLKAGAVFTNYSLNNCIFSKIIYKLFNKKYVVDGVVGPFYLRRENKASCEVYAEYFGDELKISYSEIFFKPEFGINFSGRSGSKLGIIDSFFSGKNYVLRFFARQISIYAIKPSPSILKLDLPHE
jgi:ubiquinone/menaquinone biosynthesis C-methylase UbiE